MRNLIWADLKAHRHIWSCALLVITVCAASFGAILTASSSVAAAIKTSADEHAALELQSLTSVLITFVGVAACTVIGATMRLVTNLQARTYAIWKLTGIPGRHVQTIILGQLATLGLAGGLLGALVAPMITVIYLPTWAETGLPTQIPISLHPSAAIGTILVTATCSILGGWQRAAAAARTSELQALRDAAIPQARLTPGTFLTGLAVLGLSGMCYFAGTLDGLDTAEQPDAVVAGMLLLLTALLIWAAWTLRIIQHTWTATIPDQTGLAWHLARRTCQARSAQSVNAALPYALAIGLTGTLYGIVAATGTIANGFGMLFGLIFTIATAGGIGAIAITGPQRRRDLALLQTLGANRRAQLTAQVLEGSIYAITGILFGLGTTLIAITSSALFLHIPLHDALARGPWSALVALSLTSYVLAVTTAVISTARPTPKAPTV